MSKLGQAKTDITYCVCDEKECGYTTECDRHQKRYNFDKTKNYSFCKFNPVKCIKERIGGLDE